MSISLPACTKYGASKKTRCGSLFRPLLYPPNFVFTSVRFHLSDEPNSHLAFELRVTLYPYISPEVFYTCRSGSRRPCDSAASPSAKRWKFMLAFGLVVQQVHLTCSGDSGSRSSVANFSMISLNPRLFWRKLNRSVTLLMANVYARQEQFPIGTNLNEAITVVGSIDGDSKQASDVPLFHPNNLIVLWTHQQRSQFPFYSPFEVIFSIPNIIHFWLQQDCNWWSRTCADQALKLRLIAMALKNCPAVLHANCLVPVWPCMPGCRRSSDLEDHGSMGTKM